jgi:hypothetical protein
VCEGRHYSKQFMEIFTNRCQEAWKSGIINTGKEERDQFGNISDKLHLLLVSVTGCFELGLPTPIRIGGCSHVWTKTVSGSDLRSGFTMPSAERRKLLLFPLMLGLPKLLPTSPSHINIPSHPLVRVAIFLSSAGDHTIHKSATEM